jgi:hypothetical protein
MLGYDDLSRDCYRILTVSEGKILSRKDCLWDTPLRGALIYWNLVIQMWR